MRKLDGGCENGRMQVLDDDRKMGEWGWGGRVEQHENVKVAR